MQNYLLVKSIIVLIALIGAFGLFFLRLRHLYRLMTSVQGKTGFSLDNVSERIKESFLDVLGQRNVRRKAAAGWSHTLIFFGFIAVQPHSLELMIRGVFPGFEPGLIIPGIYSGYLFIADILAPLVLVGLAYALYRRIVLKPSYLTLGKDANYIILFTAVIILTFMLINGLQTNLPVHPDEFDYSGVFPISPAFIALFGLKGLSAAGTKTLYEITYYIHIGTILGFLIYIPGSKHLHLLAAIPNVFLKPLKREKIIQKSDLEDEEAETFGLTNISETSWYNVLNLYACTECGRCEEQCPAAHTEKPLSPKKLVHDLKEDLFAQDKTILNKDFETVEPIIRSESEITEDVIWSCTTCRACEDICPVNIQHLDFMFEIRKQRVLMEASFPSEMQEAFVSLENQANPWGFAADSRADWCKDLDIPLMTDRPEAELLYFVGCAGSFDDQGKKFSRAMARILKKSGVDFAILGPEEACNGDLARRAGNEYLAQMLIQQNVETLNQYKPKRILTGCPHCYNILKNEYPDFGAEYEVINNTELILELLNSKRLKINKDFQESMTFHDSCYLGRWNGIINSPREILTQVLKNRQLIELPRSGYKGFCCGAGGARMFMEETLGKRINNDRAEEIAASGAKNVVSACPFCYTMLSDGIMETKSEVKVKDLAQIVDEATD